MKTVYQNDRIAHLWAWRAQDSARTANGSFSFCGSTLYSYSQAIGVLLADGAVLISDYNYSNTTAKHQNLMLRALRDSQTRLFVSDISSNMTRMLTDSRADYVADGAKAAAAQAKADYLAALAKIKPRTRADGRPYIAAFNSARLYLETWRHFAPKQAKKEALDLSDDTTKQGILDYLAAVHKGERLAAADKRADDGRQYLRRAITAEAGRPSSPDLIIETSNTYQRAASELKIAAATYGEYGANRKRATALRQAGIALGHVARLAPAKEHGEWILWRDELASGLHAWRREVAQWMLGRRRLMLHKVPTSPFHGYPANYPARPYVFQRRSQDAGIVWLVRNNAPKNVRPWELASALRLCDEADAMERRHNARRVAASVVDELERLRGYVADFHAAQAAGDSKAALNEARYIQSKAAAIYHAAPYARPRIARVVSPETMASAAAVVADGDRIQQEAMTAAFAAWRAGGALPATRYNYPPALRLKGQTIETSHGAVVPVECAAPLWSLVCKARATGADIETDFGNVARVGHFALDKVFSDGGLKVGCHNIPAAEIDLMAAALDFVGGAQ